MGPGWPAQLACQHVTDVDLDDNLAVEVRTGVQIEVGVGVACEAVDTAVTATAVGVDRPVERESGRCLVPGSAPTSPRPRGK